MTQAAADWYEDPNAPQQLRYWDGQQWTEHVAPKVVAATPVAASQGQANAPVTINNFAIQTTAAAGLPAGVTSTTALLRLAAYLLEGVLVIITLGIGWLIWAATTAPLGQTPAKRILGQRVVSSTTLMPVGLGKMFWVRGILCSIIVSPILFLTLGILLFMPFWDNRNQNIWDKISGTYVVDDSQDAWNTKPASL